jgi:hypothetical protein
MKAVPRADCAAKSRSIGEFRRNLVTVRIIRGDDRTDRLRCLQPRTGPIQ